MWFNEPMWLKCDVCLLAMRVAALGPEAVERIIKTIAVFDDFCHANDPYEEHDFGSFEVDGHRIFFKIDYLDQAVTCHSPDPAASTSADTIVLPPHASQYPASWADSISVV